ncbi:family 1 glycosylhydrolase, partial [bacterium]|nr:family 1 glycosylhydrolase [bacterium]
MSFPKDFVWGAATASYQIEGGAFEDGKGGSVWDMLCRRPGAIHEGQTGDVACDHYHRYEEDVDLMAQIGLKGYRFSVSWSRVIPEGRGKVNQKGLDFYDRLVDKLVAAGVQPHLTLFHWDYPYALYCKGGWLNPDSPDWFAEYAQVIVDKLSDRVTNWMTLNEPQCFIGLGHHAGTHAPGDRLQFRQVLQAAHHALIAHGKAVQVIRAHATAEPRIGYAPVGVIKYPADDSKQNIEAARKDMFSITDKTYWNNTWWMDPVFFGHYPEDCWKAYGEDVPCVRDGDMKTISQPLDFFGANIYNGQEYFVEKGSPVRVPQGDGYPLTAYHWPVTEKALYWGPRFFYERYKKPIVITENGMSNV